MRVFPTPVQRKYLDDISALASAPVMTAAEITKSGAIPADGIPPSSSSLTTSWRSDMLAVYEALRPLIARLISTGRAALSRVPAKVIFCLIVFALYGFSHAFGHEVHRRPNTLRQIEHPVASAQPVPAATAVPVPVAPEPVTQGLAHQDVAHHGTKRVPLRVLIATLVMPALSLPLLLVWMTRRRQSPATLTVTREENRPDTAIPSHDVQGEPASAARCEAKPATPSQDAWLLGFATHRGPVRRSNEDAGCAFTIGTHQVLVIADGVGGMPHGGPASEAAVGAAERAIRLAWRITPDGQEPLPRMMLSNAFAAAAARLASNGLARGFKSAADGLRTTLIVAIGSADRFDFGYIGDGGICLVRADGTVQSLLVPHKADPAVQNVLSASLGPTPQGAAVFGSVERHRSDLLVASTDGISDRVTPAFYARTLLRQAERQHGDLYRTAEGVLEQLSRHRDDDDIFAFDDNMTLGLMGDGAAPTAPEQAPVTLDTMENA